MGTRSNRKAAKNITFEGALAALEEQVKLLEEGQLTLEESLEVYKYAMELGAICRKKLEGAKQEVEKIVAAGGEDYKTETFAPRED